MASRDSCHIDTISANAQLVFQVVIYYVNMQLARKNVIKKAKKNRQAFLLALYGHVTWSLKTSKAKRWLAVVYTRKGMWQRRGEVRGVKANGCMSACVAMCKVDGKPKVERGICIASDGRNMQGVAKRARAWHGVAMWGGNRVPREWGWRQRVCIKSVSI